MTTTSIDAGRDEPRRLLDPSDALPEGIDPALGARLTSAGDALAAEGPSRRGMGAALALASAPVLLAATASRAFGQGMSLPGTVVDVLNFALTLEHLEAEFYTTAVGTAGLLGDDLMPSFDQIRKHEVAHVEFLRGVLGSRAIAKPTFDFTGGKGSGNGPFADVFRNARTAAALAQVFEDTGVRAYKGQAATLMPHGAVLRSALRIHSVEARHAAQVRRLRQQKGWITGESRGDLPAAAARTYEGEDNTFHFILAQPGPGPSMSAAFDEPLTKGQVLEAVAPFIAGGR